MIVYVAVEFLARTPGRAAGSDYFHGVRAHQPVHEIDIVKVLLDDLIAANPDEGIPVTELPLHVAPLGIAAFSVKDRAAEVVGVYCGDFADGAVVDLLHGLDILAVGAALRSRNHRQLALGGQFSGGDETPRANRIGGDGFLGENMLSGVDRRFEMHGPEAGRGAQHHDIDIGGEQLLVSVEAGEVMVRLDPDTRLDGRHQVFGFHLLGLAVALHGDARIAAR